MMPVGGTQAFKAGLAAALIMLGTLLGPMAPADSAAPDATSTFALEVAGLACPFCAYGIEKRLGKLEGVDDVEVDIADARVLVTMQPGASLTRKRAARAVDRAGFTLRGFEAVDRKAAGDGHAPN